MVALIRPESRSPVNTAPTQEDSPKIPKLLPRLVSIKGKCKEALYIIR